jgi:hypothetical protein
MPSTGITKKTDGSNSVISSVNFPISTLSLNNTPVLTDDGMINSDLLRIISGDVALAKDSKLLGVKSDNSQGNLISVGNYPDGNGGTYEQTEVGTESIPV